MKGYVAGIDWVNAEAMKYWSFSSSTSQEKRKIDTHNMIFSGEYLGALKCDGYYERLIKDEDGNCFMVARSKNVHGEAVNKIDWVPQLKEFMDKLPNGTVLLSECYLPGNEGSQKITSLLGCLKDKCVARQEKGQKLHFYIFDVMAYDGSNYIEIPFEQRVEELDHLSYQYKSPYVEWADYYTGRELWDKLQEYLASGREGIVIMRKDAPVYFKRTPARVSLKIKKELKETIDAYFTGKILPPAKEYTGKELASWKYFINTYTGERLPEGEYYFDIVHNDKPYTPVTRSYYKNFAGSLEIAVLKNGQECSLGYISGLPDEVKENWQNYKHRVVEIGGMQFDKETNRLRHGKVLKFRTPEEKVWTDCSYEQIESL